MIHCWKSHCINIEQWLIPYTIQFQAPIAIVSATCQKKTVQETAKIIALKAQLLKWPRQIRRHVISQEKLFIVVVIPVNGYMRGTAAYICNAIAAYEWLCGATSIQTFKF